MTSTPMITRDDLRKIHLYCYEDVQEFLTINRMLDEEMEKPEADMDIALVEDCLDYIEVVMSENTHFDEKTLDERYRQVLAKASPKQDAKAAKIIKNKKRSARKFFLVLAATITVLFATLTIAAKVCGYKNAWEFVRQKALDLRWFEKGEVIEENGITLTGNGELKTFATFEDFLESEGLNIMYPQSLPEGLKIESIFKYCYEDGRRIYTIQFNLENASLVISDSISTNAGIFSSDNTFEIENETFHIISIDDHTYQAVCQTSDWEYTINAPNYETLLTLLQNMKGSNS